jgi:hypothetical protein
VRIERGDGYRLVVTRWLVAPGASATTIGSWIFIREAALGSERLLRHELEHVRQYRRLGTVGFLARYLGAYVVLRARRYSHWAAYRRIPAEIEAEWLARRVTEPR